MTSSLKISGVKSTLAEIELKASVAKQAKREKAKNDLLNALKEATPVDTGAARDSWVLKNGNLHSSCKYMGRLNQGSSKQAPAHFIEQTILSNPDVIVSGSIIEESS